LGAQRRSGGQEKSRAGEDLLPELEGGPDMRVPHVSAGARKPAYRFGRGGLLGLGRFLPGPVSLPAAFSFFFLLLFLFYLFLFLL
jgi:hypothetical protein